MNPLEATKVLKKVLAYCPAQSMTDETPRAWAEALDDIRFEDAVEAVRRIGRKEADPGQSLFMEPRHIRAEVRKLRRERLDRHPQVEPPAELDPSDFMAWHRGVLKRIADGEIIEQKALTARLVDYSKVAKDLNDVRLLALQPGEGVPGQSGDDERPDEGATVRAPAAPGGGEPGAARAGHGVDV